MNLERTKKISEAVTAYCPSCDAWLGHTYWSLSKTVGLHTAGLGHKPILYKPAP